MIVGTNSWKANVTVDDSQVGLLAAGDQAELNVTGSTGSAGAAGAAGATGAAGSTQPIFGTVDSVGLISTGSSETAAFPVVVQVTGSPAGLHDGTTVNVTLIYRQLANVLTVPSAAVHTVNGQQVVYQMPANSADASGAAASAGAQADAAAADAQQGAGSPGATGAGGFAARAAAANVDVSAATTTVVTVGDTDGTNTQIKSGLSEGDLVVVTTTIGAGRTGGASGTGQRTGGFGGAGTGGFGGAGGFNRTGAGGFSGATGGAGGGN